MLIVRLSASALAVVLVLLTGCNRPGDDVLATVEGVPITAEYVHSLMEQEGDSASILVGDRPHPYRAALDLAFRDQLLALEANRRGLVGRTRGELLAALVEQEVRGLKDLDIGSISDTEARAWYRENPELFDEVASAKVTWARFQGPETARSAFDELSRSDSQTFARRVRSLSTVSTSGTDNIKGHDGSEYVLHRLTNAIRRSGVVCLDQDSTSGDWWLVRIEDLTLEPTPWDAKASAEVKSAMAFLREERHLQWIADQARMQRAVRIHEEHVRKLTR